MAKAGGAVPLWAAWLPWAIGVALLGVSAINGWRSVHLLRSGKRTIGTIVDLHTGGESDSAYPVFRFTDTTGVERTEMSAVSVATAAEGQSIGTRLPILFDPAQPGRVQEDSFDSLWVLPLATCAMGVVGIAAGTVVWKIHRKDLRKRNATRMGAA